MKHQGADWQQMLLDARGGSREQLGLLLDHARSYLALVAHELITDDLQARLDASDLVQDALCEAQQDFERFRGQTPEELLGWLKRILVHNVLNEYRRFRNTQMRNVAREIPLDAGIAVTGQLADPASTPSQGMMREEAAVILRQALQRLSPDHQRVIELRHREGLTFEEVGQRMNRTRDAARMLWVRAFHELSRELAETVSGTIC